MAAEPFVLRDELLSFGVVVVFCAVVVVFEVTFKETTGIVTLTVVILFSTIGTVTFT